MTQFQLSIQMEQDQVLLSMQQKLDNLCEQMNSLQNESMKQSINFSSENHRFAAAQKLGRRGAKLCSNRCSILDLNPGSGITPLCKNLSHRLQVGSLVDYVLYLIWP